MKYIPKNTYRIKTSILLVAFLLTLSGCEDFLEEVPTATLPLRLISPAASTGKPLPLVPTECCLHGLEMQGLGQQTSQHIGVPDRRSIYR